MLKFFAGAVTATVIWWFVGDILEKRGKIIIAK